MQPPNPHPPTPLAGLSVLVVEDSLVQRDHAVGLVRSLGAAEILEAGDGKEALETLARRADIALVLSDLEMPGMDGVAFIGELAARGFRPRVAIVSSQGAEVLRAVELMARTYGLPLVGVIPKPLDRSVLLGMLHASAQGSSQPCGNPSPGGNPGVAEIRRGVETGAFVCFYQPQVTLQGALFRGVEALVRWRHPVHGLLGPGAFLAEAEADVPLMNDLTACVLHRVAESWHAWLKRGLNLEVSVNLSAGSLGQQGFADQLLEILERLALPPKAVVFEVTESASVANLGHCLANLARLRMRGFKLSIDDFGTGFATFQQLEQLPFTELKVDRSITQQLPEGARQMAMALRMVQLARDLNLTSVAEGIETLAAWQALRQLGCDVGQGYFLARPMPPEQIPEWASLGRSHLRA